MNTFLRYFAIGGLAALVDILVFATCAKWLRLNYLMVGAAGFTLSTFVNYILSVRFVFRSGVRFERKTEVALVYLVSAVGLAINQMVLYVGIEFFDVEMILAKILATGTVYFWNYGARARFLFAPIAGQDSPRA